MIHRPGTVSKCLHDSGRMRRTGGLSRTMRSRYVVGTRTLVPRSRAPSTVWKNATLGFESLPHRQLNCSSHCSFLRSPLRPEPFARQPAAPRNGIAAIDGMAPPAVEIRRRLVRRLRDLTSLFRGDESELAIACAQGVDHCRHVLQSTKALHGFEDARCHQRSII